MVKAELVPVTVLSNRDKRILVMKYDYHNKFHQMALITLLMHEKNELLMEFMISRINPYHAYEVVIEYACGQYSLQLAETAFGRLQLLRHTDLKLEFDAYQEVKTYAQHHVIRQRAITALAAASLQNVIPFPRRK